MPNELLSTSPWTQTQTRFREEEELDFSLCNILMIWKIQNMAFMESVFPMTLKYDEKFLFLKDGTGF